MLHMQQFPLSQMAAAALQFRPVSPHLACISIHIFPCVKWGTFLGDRAWLGPNKWVQRAIALTLNAYSMAILSSGGSASTRVVMGFGGVTA